MRGNTWTVIVVGALVAVSPAVLVGDGSSFASSIEPLFSSLSVVAGLLLFVFAMGAVVRYAFGGGGSW
jgi:uncharacterized integral membrane protein